MKNAEREKWMALLESERVQHRQEIAELLERIQRPEQRPMVAQHGEASKVEIHEPPKDFAELAHLGADVSDLSDVGNTEAVIAEVEAAHRKEAEEQKEIEKVGTVIGGSE